MTGDELQFHPYRLAAPPWWPGDETGYEQYHRQLFTLTPSSSGFTRWKVLSTGINIARQLAGARNKGRAAWIAEHGGAADAWPLQHPPAVLWVPCSAYAGCLGCTWLDAGTGDRADAADAARRHAASFLTTVDDQALLLLIKSVGVWSHPAPGAKAATEAG